MATNSTQGVSAALRKAGLTRSQSASTRIRGFHSYTEGYSVERVPFDPSYAAKVSHVADRRLLPEQQEAVLKSYEDALAKAGYKSERGTYTAPTDKGGTYLWVSIA